MPIPKTMKALRVNKFLAKDAKTVEDIGQSIEVVEVAVPMPKEKQVLIRVEFSPINPADIAMAGGTYGGTGTLKVLPAHFIPGTEGSGVVAAVGKGIPGFAVGRKVTFYGPGAWAEYVVVDAITCIPLPNEVSLLEGCNSFANPTSVVAFVNIAKEGDHRNIVHTAAASALGKMLIAYAKTQGIGVIGVVRKEEQAKDVLAAGAKACLVVTDEDIEAAIVHNAQEAEHEEKVNAGPANVNQLAEALKEHKVTLGFDAVAGPLTGVLLKVMPVKSTIYVYGGLSNKACTFIRSTDLIFGQKQVKGFWAISHVKAKRQNEQKALAAQILSNVRKGQPLHTPIKGQFPVEKGIEALSTYLNDMTGGKIVFAPQAGKGAASEPAAAAVPAKKEETKTEEPNASPA